MNYCTEFLIGMNLQSMENILNSIMRTTESPIKQHFNINVQIMILVFDLRENDNNYNYNNNNFYFREQFNTLYGKKH